MHDVVMNNKFLQTLLAVLGVLLIVFVALGVVVKLHDVRDLARGAALPQKTVGATGEAKVFAKPDVVYLNYDIVSEGAAEKDARDTNQKKYADFANDLKAMGIDRVSIMTLAFDTSKDEGAAKNKRYRTTMTVQVKVEDTKTIDNTIQTVYETAMKRELKASAATSSAGQCPSFKDQTEYFTPDVRRRAAVNAYANAQKIVDAVGLTLGRVVGVTDYNTPTTYYPIPGSCSLPVPGIPLVPVELTASVNVTFEVQ